MGALPQFSVVAGQHRKLNRRLIHRLFESNLQKRGATSGDYNDATDNSTALISLAAEANAATERRITYATLNATANRYARAIRQQLRSGKDADAVVEECPNADGDWIVAVCMPPTVDLIAVLLAIWKVGAAYLPLDAEFPRHRIEHILGEAKPALTLVADEQQTHLVADVATNRWTFAELQSHAVHADAEDLTPSETLLDDDDDDDDSRLAIVLYTSGSTGIPKGVRLPHSILHNRLQWQLDTFPFASTERTAVFKTALTFVDSVAEIWAPLLSGLAVVVVPKAVLRDPEHFVDVLETYAVERLVLVPTLLRTLLMYLPLRRQQAEALTAGGARAPNVPLRRLRIWVCSGETLPAQLVHEFYAYFGDGDDAQNAPPPPTTILCNFYGSTEIMGDVTYHVCRPNGETVTCGGALVPIGCPIDNTIVYVLDGDMRPVKVGETGELWVAGRNLAAGYVNGRDQFRFVANPLSDDPVYNRLYRTGDFASVLSDGSLRYDGRTDSQIKIRGHRVDLTEIERQLLMIATERRPVSGHADADDDDEAVPQIDKGLVLCHRAGEIDQALVAFVTLRNGDDGGPPDVVGAETAAQRIEAALAGRLADYMVPQVLVIETIPLLVNGKVDRQALLRLYADTNTNVTPAAQHHSAAAAIDYTGVQTQHVHIARDLFETIAAAIGRSARRAITAQANFYHLGGNSLNSIYTVTQLRAMGYRLGIREFIAAACLAEVVEIMARAAPTTMMTTSSSEDGEESSGGGTADVTSDEDADLNSSEMMMMRFNVLPLAPEHRDDVINLMTHSFTEKADLESMLRPHITYDDYADIFEQLFEPVCRQGLSFVVHDAQHGCIVGAALNTDAHREPALRIRSQLAVVFDFLHEIQQSVRDAYPTTDGGQLFHAGMMGTSGRLSAQENIAAVHCMERAVLRMAHAKGFANVFTTNTSPLTQQLACHVHGYETVARVQVNRWQTADGWRPFAEATDDQAALVQMKRIG